MEDVEDDLAQGAEVLRRVADVGLVVVFPEKAVSRIQWQRFSMLQWLRMAFWKYFASSFLLLM